MSYDNLIEQTFPEHWPNSVQALAVPHEAMFVEKDDLIAMASGFPKLREEFDLRKVQNFSDLSTDWGQAKLKCHMSDALDVALAAAGVLPPPAGTAADAASFRAFRGQRRSVGRCL